MYRSKYDTEYRDETRFAKKNLIWLIVFLFLVSGVVWVIARPAKIAEKVIDNSLVNYEEFQEIYNTCQKINTDLGTIKSVDENDRMFVSFSKQAVIANKKQQMSRWVEEYNAKSRMWNRSMWKSDKLPYQLDVNQFSNFN